MLKVNFKKWLNEVFQKQNEIPKKWKTLITVQKKKICLKKILIPLK